MFSFIDGGDEYSVYDDDDDSQEYSDYDSDGSELLSVNGLVQEEYDDFINYASAANCIFNPQTKKKDEQIDETESRSYRSRLSRRTSTSSRRTVTFDVDDDSEVTLDDDESTLAPFEDAEEHLIDLAICAARMQHEVHGIEFDEDSEIDVENDLNFFVVKIRKPMGILFQENSSGCWVAKVLPKGNAAKRHYLGKNVVEVGDQLASIDGKSAYKMTVGKLARTVKKVHEKDYIELTCLRYVGLIKANPDSSPNGDDSSVKSDDKLAFLYGLKSPANEKRGLLNSLSSTKKMIKMHRSFSFMKLRSKKKIRSDFSESANNNSLEVVIEEERDDANDDILDDRERSTSQQKRVGNVKKLMCVQKLL